MTSELEARMNRANILQAKEEADRLAMLAAPLIPLSEGTPMIDKTLTDPDAPAPNSMPIDEWMAHEQKRQAKRESDRLAAQDERDGNIGPRGLVRGCRGAYRY